MLFSDEPTEPCPARTFTGFDPAKVKIASAANPRVFIYENFLTDEECDHIIELSTKLGLVRSQVAGPSTNQQSKVRTSFGTFLNSTEDPVLLGIEEKISVWTQLPVENGEPFYLLRYGEGEEYKPHFDFFDPQIPGMNRFIYGAGQRTATVLLYLYTPENGGETTFPRVNLLVPAVRGTAVLFWSHTNDYIIDKSSLHGGLPVGQGVKYCCTKWIRENAWELNRPKFE